MIKAGDTIPSVSITVAAASGHQAINADALFSGKKVVLFAVPGAFTPTCSEAHLPGYVMAFDDFKAKGVDMVACVSVNDAFVMQAWGEAQNADHMTLLADGGGAFTKALGLEMETGDFGGLRSQRYAMLIEAGVVKFLSVEEPKAFEVSKAEVVLGKL